VRATAPARERRPWCRRAGLSAAGVAVTLAAAACGGSALSGKALEQEATSLQALAAEGSLLADDAARGDTTQPFVRVHGGYLRDAASSSSAVFTQGGTAAAQRLAALARRVSDDLDRLAHSGSDRATQRLLERELSALGKQVERLGKSP
jgi:hypothetical protein